MVVTVGELSGGEGWFERYFINARRKILQRAVYTKRIRRATPGTKSSRGQNVSQGHDVIISLPPGNVEGSSTILPTI
jgi:hypothetical protein